MAVRRPLYYSGGNLRALTESQVLDQQDYGTTLWGKSAYRAINLSYVASGGSLRRMIDSRDTAGDLGNESNASNNTRFNDNSPDAAVDAGVTVSRDHIDQDATGTYSLAGLNYPVYATSSGDIQIMNDQDVRDTYVDQILSNLVDGTDRGGLYSISTNSSTYANHTLISFSPVFVDTRFDKSIHGGVTTRTTLEILELSSVDQPTTIDNFYLWRRDEESPGSFIYPLYWTGSDLRRYTPSEWETFLGTWIAYDAIYTVGSRIRYNVEGTGTDAYTIPSSVAKATMGTAMVDTTLNSSVRIDDQDNDNYRSAILPTGGNETETTYELKIYRF